jgi:hypothetical protein
MKKILSTLTLAAMVATTVAPLGAVPHRSPTSLSSTFRSLLKPSQPKKASLLRKSWNALDKKKAALIFAAIVAGVAGYMYLTSSDKEESPKANKEN